MISLLSFLLAILIIWLLLKLGIGIIKIVFFIIAAIIIFSIAAYILVPLLIILVIFLLGKLIL
ncbi:hypothetical protein FP435_07740 [Lactobacillus sp. PV037]|uniref:hypothetical protein n=1 Tax=Lactobacillus sp. PV012 TaxID=2594494 RepID=UPI00223F4B48|nr:hypothetical protein [Lactobacillus sp. PV012]QNQ81636.1 hypothetical protein FP433_00515 [Lactobacillus sp. PV012]QNQ84317.1 hypothetical protein FP435_07740 [Lactobacillus sp. PV037]